MRFIYFLLLLSVVVSCSNQKQNEKDDSSSTNTSNTDINKITTVVNSDSLLSVTGQQVLSILKNKRYDSLPFYFSDSVHFSPYGFIGSGNQTLTGADFAGLLSSNKKINWGDYDPGEDSIFLSAKTYIEKFVYNANFLHAEKTAIDSFIGSGNSLNNLKEKYPGCRFIEYHFTGFDKKYEGMDWTSLRLVFTKSGNQFLLIAFVNDRWTP